MKLQNLGCAKITAIKQTSPLWCLIVIPRLKCTQVSTTLIETVIGFIGLYGWKQEAVWLQTQPVTTECVSNATESLLFQSRIVTKKKYCAGDMTKTSSCMPFWSKWLMGNCSATKCNLTGQTVKSRKCLYGDRSEAANTDLCSSESASLTKKCKLIFVSLENSTKIVECNPFWSAWLITNCSSIGCNSIGSRVKTRKCFHGDGTETKDILMCSS